MPRLRYPKSEDQTLVRRLSAVLALVALIIALAVAPVAAQELTAPLTSDEVQCYEGQLSALLGRMRITGAGPFGPHEDGIPWALFLSPGRTAYSFGGVGLSTSNFNNPRAFDPTPVPIERQLAFHIDVSPSQLLLDPRRPPLPQATLVREEPATNLVPATSEFRLIVSLDTGFSGTQGPLAIVNNFAVPPAGRPYNGFLASASQPGRGLLPIAGAACSNALTEQDSQVLGILRRMLRATIEDLDDGCSSCAGHSSHQVSLFRGEGAHEYLFNIYPYRHNGTRLGRISGKLSVNWNPTGSLTTGQLEVFPRCTGGQLRSCSDTPIDLSVSLVPPGFSGVSYPPVQALGFALVRYLAAAGQANGPVPVDFARLLSQSAWN